jgi:hypothetical protein
MFFLLGHWDPFFLGEGPEFVLVSWRGGLGFVYSYRGDQYTIFFSTADFFFIPDLGGTMAPAGPPIGPSLPLHHHPYGFIFHLHKVYVARSSIFGA